MVVWSQVSSGVGSTHAGVDCAQGQGTGVRKVGHAEEGHSLLSPSIPAVVFHHV